MKANIGIRRRLAPLLDNDTNQIELFTALLLSLPGSPVLYYGDEIGMGDNIWLGDRDGVRTPMQWTPDRNAGFSAATPGKLHLPAIQDPVYGYQSVNVEAQLENASSLLHWTRRMIHARRGHPAFGLGTFTDLGGTNPTVLSYAREHDDRRRHRRDRLRQQPVALPAAGGARPASVRGDGARRAARRRARSRAIGELPYLLTLGGYGFYWFRLTRPATEEATRPVTRCPCDAAERRFIEGARWFGGKGRAVRGHRRPPARLGRDRHGRPGRRSTCVTLDLRRRRRAASSTSCRWPSTPSAQERLDHAFVGWWEDAELGGYVHAYDAVHDREAMAGWLRAFDQPRDGAARCEFHRLPGPRPRPRGALDAVLRRAVQLLGGLRRRRAAQGVPQGHARREPRHRGARVLTEAGSDHVAALYGWLEVDRTTSGRAAPAGDAPAVPAHRQRRLGRRRWPASATCSPRPTCTPTRWAATSPARRPGWASRWPRCTRPWPSTSPPHVRTRRAAGRAGRRDDRAGSTPPSTWCPTWRTYADGLRATFDAVADVRRRAGAAGARRPPPRPDAAHRQGLEDRRLRGRARQAAGRAGAARLRLARRRRHAAVLRLRPARGRAHRRPGRGRHRRRAARLPGGRVGRAQLRGLPRRPTPAASSTDDEQTLLDAYVADKAVYEAVYEARNRPTWVPVPLTAIERLAG